jgi:hypothetical protein
MAACDRIEAVKVFEPSQKQKQKQKQDLVSQAPKS